MLITLLATVQKAISARLKYWETLRELRNLSERDLRDLGIRRCDFHFIAKQTAESV